MLDTNICIELLCGTADHVASRMQDHEIDEIAISSITLAELQYGAARSARPAHHETLLIGFCAPLAILPFDDRAGQAYGCVRAELERAGTPIGPLDTLIAAHALALNVTLVTNNEREFSRVVGLAVENWIRS
ncbi:MAG: type II toxin-antitoxin system VapC family toxin [Planctomycetes bacterium]|nr:type II toxin-antitoxin system VapC family toxin [Planctomycetota bacterium]